jgi:hypothetical protein
MRNHDMIDPLETRHLGGNVVDARGVAIQVFSRIDEQRFSLWRDEECGSTSTNVYPVDFQRSGFRFIPLIEAEEDNETRHSQESFHRYLFLMVDFCDLKSIEKSLLGRL